MSKFNAREARAKLKELIKADRIFITKTHAIPRMKKHGITDIQVIRILKGGSIVEGPSKTTSGWWRANYAGQSAGRRIEVVAELQESGDETVLVITTF